MTWIRTVLPAEDPAVAEAATAQRMMYPAEYVEPVKPQVNGELPGIVASHSLIPSALYHAFATFGVLLSADLPLSRAQHEMIATVVSAHNRCVY